MINSSLISKTFLFLVLTELLSFFAWLFPQFNLVCFVIILLLVLILALKKLSYGLYIAFAEIIVGSYGYLFSFNYYHTLISLRVGIFLVIMSAWLIYLLRFSSFKKYYHQLKDFIFIKYYLLLALVLLWGFIWGIIRHNNFGNVFLDFNNWLFYLYLLPLISVSQNKKFWHEFYYIILTALSWLLLKTLILLYIFSHNFLWAWPELYTWLRDTRVGEITKFTNNFYRIFLQSQIFALIGFFAFLPLLNKIKLSFNWFKKNKTTFYYFIFLISCFSVVVISFSRSFWVGLIIGLITYLLFLIIYQHKHFIKNILRLMSIVIFSLVIIFVIINAPPGLRNIKLVSLLSQRTSQLEAAGSSRINMLQPLSQAITKHSIVGSGFGTTVTYRSVDPRVLTTTAGASGLYTTYAFEWGYLDLFLKIGLLGVSIYLLLIYRILQSLWQQINIKSNFLELISSIKYSISDIGLGLSLALISLLIVNAFTPYLNHPLGISIILIISVYLNAKKIIN